MDHTAVILSAGRELKPVCQKVRNSDNRKNRKKYFYLALAGESWLSGLSAPDVDQTLNNLDTGIHNHMGRSVPLQDSADVIS